MARRSLEPHSCELRSLRDQGNAVEGWSGQIAWLWDLNSIHRGGRWSTAASLGCRCTRRNGRRPSRSTDGPRLTAPRGGRRDIRRGNERLRWIPFLPGQRLLRLRRVIGRRVPLGASSSRHQNRERLAASGFLAPRGGDPPLWRHWRMLAWSAMLSVGVDSRCHSRQTRPDDRRSVSASHRPGPTPSRRTSHAPLPRLAAQSDGRR
jgi:hypothetical protein